MRVIYHRFVQKIEVLLLQDDAKTHVSRTTIKNARFALWYSFSHSILFRPFPKRLSLRLAFEELFDTEKVPKWNSRKKRFWGVSSFQNFGLQSDCYKCSGIWIEQMYHLKICLFWLVKNIFRRVISVWNSHKKPQNSSAMT